MKSPHRLALPTVLLLAGAAAAHAASGGAPSGPEAAAAAKKWLELSKIPYTPEQFGFVIAACDTEKVKLFLSAGMDPNTKVSSVGTAMKLAISKAQPDTNSNCGTVFQLLVSGGGKVTGDDLLEVVGLKNRTFVEIVLGQKVDVNTVGPDGSTPATIAARSRSLGVMETLRDAGADINKADGQGHTPLMNAIDIGDPDMVRFILATPRLDLSRKDKFGRTALALARIQSQARMNAQPPWNNIVDMLVAAKAPE